VAHRLRVLHGCAALMLAAAVNAQDVTAFIGTYTGPQSKGIYSLQYDPATGKLSNPTLAIESSNPSFLAVNGKYLYAANEDQDGAVSAYAIDGAKLTFKNRVSSRGASPCHIAVDHSGKWLFVANYVSGSVAVLPIRADGSLGEASAVVQHQGSSANRERQEGPHAHQVVLSPDNRYLLVADLGTDQVFVYRFDPAKGTLAEASAPKLTPGSGPRHLAFAPNGRFVYVVNELTAAVDVFRWNGSLERLDSASMLPSDYRGAKSGAEIAIHPSGNFLFASNRGHDSIAMFRIAADGKLTPIGHVPTGGKTPRNFVIDPTGKFLLAANQDSGDIVTFEIDATTGMLKPLGSPAAVPAPVSIAFSK
jgi:6-phosphogluconolactonase